MTGRTRTIGRRRMAATAVGALLVVGTAMAPAGAAATVHGADLVTRVKILGLGSTPYVALRAGRVAPPFRVVVTTKNQGDAPAAPSFTLLSVDAGTQGRLATWKVPALAPGQRNDHTVTVSGLHMDLGFTDVVATVDAKSTVSETQEANNRQRLQIPVEPYQWLVKQWKTEDNMVVLDNSTTAVTPRFSFHFESYDATGPYPGFAYTADGDFLATPTKYPGCESISVNQGANLLSSPLLDSGSRTLVIRPDLRTYQASVRLSGHSFTASCRVAGQSFPIQVGFLDLRTGVGIARKAPQATRLTGTASQSGPTGGAKTWTWTFTADL